MSIKRNNWDSSDVTLTLAVGGALLGMLGGIGKAYYTKKEVNDNDRDLAKFRSNRFLSIDAIKTGTADAEIIDEKEASVGIGGAASVMAASDAAGTASKLYGGYVVYDILSAAWKKGLSNPISTYINSDRSVLKDSAIAAGSMLAGYKLTNMYNDDKLLKKKERDYLSSERGLSDQMAKEMKSYYSKEASGSIFDWFNRSEVPVEIGISSAFSTSGRSNLGEKVSTLSNSVIMALGLSAFAIAGVSGLGSYSLARRSIGSNKKTARLRKLGEIRKRNKSGNRFEI